MADIDKTPLTYSFFFRILHNKGECPFMADESSVFGLRLESNLHLEPGKEDLGHFLASRKSLQSRATHEADLSRFRGQVRLVEEYGRESQQVTKGLGIQDRMFYSALSYSSFYSPALLGVIELYKYYFHQFLSIDVRKPQAFIQAAEQEIASLNPKKRVDAEKIARLRDLVKDRRNMIISMGKKKGELSRELKNIAGYVRLNIARISGRCEKAIIFLVQLQTEGSEEQRLIADIKDQFKQDLKDGLQRGGVTMADVEAARKDLAVLSKEIAALIREDVFALSSLYEAIQEHTIKIVARMEQLLTEAERMKTDSSDAALVFSRIEETLVTLVSDLRLTFKPVIPPTSTKHGKILEQKREEMLASFREQVRRERRTRTDRRTGNDRRKVNDPAFKGPERRSGAERRTGKGRRRV